MYLGMARYRGAAIFPGPGWEEDVARLEREIKDLKKKYEIQCINFRESISFNWLYRSTEM